MTDVNNYKVEVEVIEETTTIIEELMTPTFIALAASVAAATVIVILLIALICHRLCRPNPGYVVAKVQDGEIDLTKLPENSNYHTTGASLHPKLELLEYPRNDIIYIRDIGQGAFGRVFQVRKYFSKLDLKYFHSSTRAKHPGWSQGRSSPRWPSRC